METKLDSRQGQFPASFPDTFKNFFAMMNEDEDHMDLFSNLLEDKVIPRATKFPQRRYGGSLRCTTNPHRQGLDGEGRDGCGAGAGGMPTSGGHNVGRSNSFRFNRPRNSFTSASSSGLNSLGIQGSLDQQQRNCVGAGGGGGSGVGVSNINTSKLGGGSSGNLLCKHIKYCCLHQQQKNMASSHTSSCMHQATQPQQQQLFHHQPSVHYGQQKSYQQQQQLDYTIGSSPACSAANSNTCGNGSGAGMQHATSTTRLGPDGEDNSSSGPLNNGLSNCLANGQQHHQQTSKQQQQQQQHSQPQKRHSIILERAFDFDASCDESDTISTTSSTPTTTNVPYNILKPILKQPQQSQHQHQTTTHQVIVQQSATTTIQPKSILKDNSQQHHMQQQLQLQQQQQQLLQHTNQSTSVMPPPCTSSSSSTHRTLPQPPKNAGIGAFHTKEAALARIQQQSGLLQGSRTNLASLCGGPPAPPPNHHYASSMYGGGGGGGVGMGVGTRSCSTFNMTTIGNNNANASTMGIGSNMMASNNNNHGGNFASISGYMDLHSPTHIGMGGAGVGLGNAFSSNKLNETLLNTHANSLSTSSTRTNLQSIRTQKSPILNRRRSSSIVANLLTADFTYNRGNAVGNSSSSSSSSAATTTPGGAANNPQSQQQQQDNMASSNNDATNISSLTHSNTRDRIAMVKSPTVTHSKPSRMNLIPVDTGGVLTFQQAMSGAVSPQYSATSPLYGGGAGSASLGVGCGTNNSHLTSSASAAALGGGGGGPTASELDMLLEDSTSTASPTSTVCGAIVGGPSNGPFLADTPTGECNGLRQRNDHHGMFNAHTPGGGGSAGAMVTGGCCLDDMDSPTAIPHERIAGVGSSMVHGGSSATIAQLGNKQRQRMRTSSMPAESRKPRLADTRRQAIHCADLDLEYYRLRSFSITSHGVCNLGDSLRSRRSRSINSVTSTGTSNSGKDRHNSNASRTSADILFESDPKMAHATSGSVGGGGVGVGAGAGTGPGTVGGGKAQIPVYKIAMLGASGVGKTTLTYQFTTSDYICAYDLSLDDDYGQKTVSVLVDGIETDLEIIDHPACEMSTEAFCSTYNIDLFVVVYSVVDRNSFKQAEKILQYLKENEMLLTRGAILVGNKTDLERHREVNRQMGRKVAKEIACKFIETSSGLDHNVDELLVGIVAQVKLNPQRLRNLSEKDRQRLNLQSTIQKHRRMYAPPRRMVRQMSMCQVEDEDNETGGHGNNENELFHDENQSNNIMGDEGIGTGSERTASTSLSSASTSKGPIRKPNKRTLNLESILKMGESELEDEEEAQRLASATNQYGYHHQSKPTSKFELLTSGNPKTNVRTPFGSVNSSPKSRKSYDSSSGVGSAKGLCHEAPAHYGNETQAEDSLLNDCNRKTVSKLTSRTKVFLSSVLRFRKAINVAKRRNSSSCSDLFVI